MTPYSLNNPSPEEAPKDTPSSAPTPAQKAAVTRAKRELEQEGHSVVRRQIRFHTAMSDERFDAVVESLVLEAVNGNIEAIKLVLAYELGKPAQTIKLGNDGPRALRIEIREVAKVAEAVTR